MKIAVVFIKGGVGKTTTAVHIAAHLASQAPTLLIDADAPQFSACSWAAWRRTATLPKGRGTPVTVPLKEDAVYQEGGRLSQAYTHTVIDAGGRDSTAMRAALLLADRVVVPVSSSNIDLSELEDFFERYREAKALNPDLEVRVLVTKTLTTRRNYKRLAKSLEEQAVPRFAKVVGQREVYVESVGDGLTVEETRPRVAAATHEMSKVYQELLEDWS